ncbi:MFS general substrate transporter [Suillus hirtellus]|nr:MFS general substrate transporter [Suillus hirtellus]
MIAPQNDEETPLPWDQIWVILLLEMPDFLSSRTLNPFIPQLIRDIGVTRGDESQVGHYAGILESSYYAAHTLTLTVFHWSQLSDRIGRKPVILTALLAISISMFSFGLSKTFGLVVSRIVCGAFDASDSMAKSSLMDITDATDMPKAYSYIPIPWMIAGTVGALVGGSLSRPADRFPDIFGRSELLKTYPYLLPCSISAFLILTMWLVTYIRLKESVSTKTPLWELIKGGFFGQSYSKPRQPLSNVIVDPGEVKSKPLPLRALLTSKVLSVTASYATTGLFQMGFNSLLPVFYATPIELGGLSLDPSRIGTLLAASSAIHGIFLLLFYTRLNDCFGARAIHITGVSSGIPIVILFPVANALSGSSLWNRHGGVALDRVLPAAAPNRASRLATTGIVMVAVAVARIIGPASATSVFSYSLQEGHDAWSIYYFLIVVVFLAVGTASLLPRDPSVWEDSQ